MDRFYEVLTLQINRLGRESRCITGIPQLIGRRAGIQTGAWIPPQYTGWVMNTVRAEVNHHSTTGTLPVSACIDREKWDFSEGQWAVLSQLVFLIILSFHKIYFYLFFFLVFYFFNFKIFNSYFAGTPERRETELSLQKRVDTVCSSELMKAIHQLWVFFFFNFLKTFLFCIGV